MNFDTEGAIVVDLAEMPEPIVGVGVFRGVHCALCNRLQVVNAPREHEPSCPWQRARQLLGAP